MTDFDPAEHTAKEVIAHVEENPGEAEAIAEAEADGKDRSTVADAAEKVTSARKSKRKPRSGTYTLEKGDSPAVVARNLYGRGSIGRLIVEANPGVKWRPGVEITLPEVD